MAPNEETVSSGGTKLTLASRTGSHNANLAHLLSLDQLGGGEKGQVARRNCLWTEAWPMDGAAEGWPSAPYLSDLLLCSFVSYV